MPGMLSPCAIPTDGVLHPGATPPYGETGAIELNPADIDLLVALQGNV
jgi:hypothetical protein